MTQQRIIWLYPHWNPTRSTRFHRTYTEWGRGWGWGTQENPSNLLEQITVPCVFHSPLYMRLNMLPCLFLSCSLMSLSSPTFFYMSFFHSTLVSNLLLKFMVLFFFNHCLFFSYYHSYIVVQSFMFLFLNFKSRLECFISLKVKIIFICMKTFVCVVVSVCIPPKRGQKPFFSL